MNASLKKLIFIFISFCVNIAIGQKTHLFTLSGSINMDSGTIKFLPAANADDYPEYFNFSAVQVVNGKFLIKGYLQEPVKLRLYCGATGNATYISEGFFLDSGAQTIVCKADTTSYDREIPDIHNETMDRYISSFFSPEYLTLDTVSDYLKHKNLVRVYIKEYAKKHPDSYISLWELAEYLERGYDPELDSGYSYLSTRIKNSFSGEHVQEDLIHLRLTAIGKPFPTVTYFDIYGKRKQLSYPEMKSKYTLVDFWFSHCPPCIGQFPDFIKTVNRYHNKGFSLIGISSDTSVADIAAWKNVIHDHSLNWVQYRTDDASMKNLRINFAPSNFLLDSEGIIIAKDLDTYQLEAFLQEKLN